MNFWNFWTIIYVLAALGGLFYFARYRLSIIRFVGEVRVELEKCSWPWDPNLTGFKKYKELIESTIVVVISVVLLAAFVTTCDFFLAHLVGALTGTGLSASSLTAPTPPAPR